ncbi:MAG: thermonuclease family protein [Patescibacteria group bacterium]
MKKKKSRVPNKLRIGAGIAAAGVAAASLLWMTSGKGKALQVPAYEVTRVIDGDTFVTKEDQHIRVASTEAPELDMCGGTEAKVALEKLILGKPVYMKILYRDPYDRLVSLVYSEKTFINAAMLAGGYSYYARSSPGEIGEELKDATEKAREGKKGIFSASCTQMKNAEKPSCNIKGNTRNGDIYYVPTCGVYDNVEVQLYLGDQWFCSEKEAIKAGFRRPVQCK